jgi:diadenosine tetraphosphate (Ap4A) HIT family hydrolase
MVHPEDTGCPFQMCPGWSVVILKRHANELFELRDDELSGFWRDVANAARALHAVYKPVRSTTPYWAT